jgi:transposase-like protein
MRPTCVQGRWQYLYRAIDRDGNLVDIRLSDSRDLAAAEAFFRSAWAVTGVTLDRITTDGHDAYPGAIRGVFREQVTHRIDRYLNNHLEIVFSSTCALRSGRGLPEAPGMAHGRARQLCCGG